MNGIGQTLKEAREKKGLTLDDLQQTTKIQKLKMFTWWHSEIRVS